MTQDEGIALLKRIVEAFSSHTDSRMDYVTVKLIYGQTPASQTWLINIDGWNIESEEDWQEYWDEHRLADGPREFIVDTETQEGE